MVRERACIVHRVVWFSLHFLLFPPPSPGLPGRRFVMTHVFNVASLERSRSPTQGREQRGSI